MLKVDNGTRKKKLHTQGVCPASNLFPTVPTTQYLKKIIMIRNDPFIRELKTREREENLTQEE
jgi:hypothetical protein